MIHRYIFLCLKKRFHFAPFFNESPLDSNPVHGCQGSWLTIKTFQTKTFTSLSVQQTLLAVGRFFWGNPNLQLFQLLVDCWFGARVVWDSNRGVPKQQSRSEVGDLRNPNHQLTISWPINIVFQSHPFYSILRWRLLLVSRKVYNLCRISLGQRTLTCKKSLQQTDWNLKLWHCICHQ